MKRRTFIARTSTLVLLLTTPHIARAAGGMLAVRMWPSEDYTRVTIESDWLLDTSQFMLTEPHRFVVDIKGMQLNKQFEEMSTLVQATDPYVSSIRVGQFQENIVRIVFDLKQTVESNVFALAPVAEYKNRLVLDFKPIHIDQDAATLNQLVEQIASDQEEAITAGNQNEADILGDWLHDNSQTPITTSTIGSPQTPRTIHRRPTPSKIPVNPPTQAAIATSPDKSPSQGPTTTIAAPPKSGRLRIIAIDPGHGGEDPGAVGASGTKEKDIVLAIGKLLRDQINAQPNMRAFMTRDADFFVPLAQRVEKARAVKADLFISIHADAFTNRSAKGASVFALSERGASSTTARMLADKENQSDLIGGVDVKTRDRQTANILLSMSTAAQIKDSIKLGKLVIKELQAFAHMHKTNVEQAGFAVLKAPDIPSILVETAFISNLEEERKLRDKTYQKKLAEAIMRSVKLYLAQNPALARG